MWLGPAKTEAVFDTGSTRNSIDKEYLKALLQEDKTSPCVLKIEDIKPLTCRSVDKNNPIVVKQIAYLTVTFKESDQIGTTKDLGFCIVPDSTEDVIIGKPTLDALGFVSDRHSIELRTEDVRFPTILPEKLPNGKDQFLHLADHVELDGRVGQTTIQTVNVVARKQHCKGHWWLEAGPDLPLGVEVIEGPLVQSEPNRCRVSFLVDTKVRIGPAANLVKVREMTAEDEKLLEAVNKTDREASEAHDALQACVTGAEESALSSSPVKDMPKEEQQKSSAAFLVSNYLKKGKKERQAELFPELEKEIAEGRSTMHDGIKWPDQSSEEYKREVVDKSEKLIGPKATAKHRSSLASRILKPFSAVFWMIGCRAPRVDGYVADIRPRADAQPRVLQPLELSEFDLKRMEYH